MPLNPNASAFSFNPGAADFVPSFSPATTPVKAPEAPTATPEAVSLTPSAQTNGAPKESSLAKALSKSLGAPEFVPGGSPSSSAAPAAAKPADKAEPAPKKEAAAAPAPAPAPAGKSWASMATSKAPAPAPAAPAPAPAARTAAASPQKPAPAAAAAAAPATPPAAAAAVPAAAPRRKGERFALKALLEMRPRASALGSDKECMRGLRKMLEETPELDPEKEMPARQPAESGGGRGKGGNTAGTPRKGGRNNKNDQPLRDRNGKIIEIKALEVSENRWKPSKPTDEEEKVYKAIKGLLNKLTLEKFDKLYGELLNSGISNVSLMRGLVVLVYDKAVLEPTFIKMYAQMCKRLAADLPKFEDEDGELPFGDVLVGKCRSEFEQMGQEPEREGLADLPKDEQDQKLRKMGLRTLGNVEFIGELFKCSMVGSEDVRMSIDKLMSEVTGDQDRIHPLCKLMEGVGKLLEEQDKEAMDGYFAALQDLANGGTLNSRYKFMIMDLVDVRAKGWKARREVAGPKVLEDIKKEVEKENRYTEKKKDKEEAPKKKEKKKVKEIKVQVEDDGWSMAPGTKVMSAKQGKGVKGAKAAAAEAPPSPGGAAKAASKGISTSKSAFAALMDMGSDDDDEDDSDEDESEEVDSEEEEEEEEEEAEKVHVHGPELDEEAADKVGYILEEFLCAHDVNEAVECMIELHQLEKYSKAVLDEALVRRGLGMALDASPKECTLMSQMYGNLIDQGILLPQDCSKGFCDIFLDLADIAIDIPKAPELLNTITGNMLEKGHLTGETIKTGLATLQQEDQKNFKFFEALFQSL